MKLRNFQYFLKEGFRSFWVNGLMSAASVIIVMASLLLFGVYIIFSMNINYIGNQLLEQYEIQVFLSNDCTLERADEIGNEIRAIEHVTGAEYLPKDEALADYREKLGDSGSMLDGLENDNPLPDSFKITLDDLSNSKSVVEKIKQIPNVENINNNKEAMDKLTKISSVLKHASMALVILLSIISVFIISNTIRITLYARRRDINIMKYLGATNKFISSPFVIEGVIIGLIGAIIAMIIVLPVYNYFIGHSGNIFASTIKLYKTGEIFLSLTAWFGGIGVALGAVGSAISIRRHLNV